MGSSGRAPRSGSLDSLVGCPPGFRGWPAGEPEGAGGRLFAEGADDAATGGGDGGKVVAGGAKGEIDLREVPLAAGGENAAEALAVGWGAIVRRALGKIRRGVDKEEISRGRQRSASSNSSNRKASARWIRRNPCEDDLGVVVWMEVLPPAPG